MKKIRRVRTNIAVVLGLFGAACIVSCGDGGSSGTAKIGTVADRQALVDYLIEKTMEREAFSPAKNKYLNLDVESSMRAEANAVVNADSEESMFYALSRLSSARKDRHLSVSGIERGLAVPDYYPGSEVVPPVAPVRLDFDYSVTDGAVLFVSDVAIDAALALGVQAGDLLLSINGVDPSQRLEDIRPYIRYSTELGYRKKFTQYVTTRTGLLPPGLYRDTLDLTLQKSDGESYEVSLEYVNGDSIQWTSESRDRYPGYERVAENPTFDLYVNNGDVSVIVLDWHRFSSSLMADMDWLMDYSVANDLLNHDIVFDATRGGGGSLGAYAIQRLSPKSFKTTFGNLRISDVIPEFIARNVENFERNAAPTDSGGKETIDDGTWLIDWLTDDVQKAYDAGQEYSNNVPFKLAHAPKDSDGLIQPAAVHFTGNMVCLMGPNGGSHLDQFYSIVTDNDLCPTIGMKTGGYSNTWEWHEDVVFPTTGEPVVEFMWNIGHTISPNGKIVEGDPADLDELIPLTYANYAMYDLILLNRALEILATD